MCIEVISQIVYNHRHEEASIDVYNPVSYQLLSDKIACDIKNVTRCLVIAEDSRGHRELHQPL